MKLVCYAYKNEKGELQAPFLDYLKKYAISDQDSEKKRHLKLKQLANLESHLLYLSDHQGRYDLPPVAQKYKNHSIGILKIKESAQLVRIAFFARTGDKIILLNAIDKPKLYEKGKKLQVDKMIEKFLDQAEAHKEDYLSNNHSIPLNLNL
jgi:hypothetical protein